MKTIKLTENQMHKIVENVLKSVLNEGMQVDSEGNWFVDDYEDDIDTYDVWSDAEYEFSRQERLPRGWTSYYNSEGERIYSDGDGNEYTKDEYGHFKLN